MSDFEKSQYRCVFLRSDSFGRRGTIESSTPGSNRRFVLTNDDAPPIAFSSYLQFGDLGFDALRIEPHMHSGIFDYSKIKPSIHPGKLVAYFSVPK